MKSLSVVAIVASFFAVPACAIVERTAPEAAAGPTYTPPHGLDNSIRVCVVQGGQLVDVLALYHPATRDTTVANNQRFSTAYPVRAPDYAANEPWFIRRDSISLSGKWYSQFEPQRIIAPSQLKLAGGGSSGVPVFAERTSAAPHDTVYIPTRTGCEFQPYRLSQ